ncbi:MAG: hypothetical protein DHS20C13_10760 [Thermodesulfobacteriota bacterium]|nr:MAG: hypothetical protein DHS20C13_10760 [Thermodesulfobacteriota bacterium]
MGKLLILLLIILIAFWVGRLSVSSKKEKISKNNNQDESEIIDIEIEDET